MSADAPSPNGAAGKADDLIREIRANTIAVAAQTVTLGFLIAAVKANTKAMQELALDEHDADCEDADCEGECLEEEEPAPRRRGRRK